MSEKETKKTETASKATPESAPKKLPRVCTHIKAGPNRRAHDHIGNFNA